MENNITFQKFDKESPRIDIKIDKLSDFVYQHRTYRKVLRDIVFQNSHWSDDTIQRVKKSLERYKKAFVRSDDEKVFEEFASKVIAMYNIVTIPNIVKELHDTDIIYNPSKQAVLDVLRGRLFEKICVELLSKRFVKDKYLGCDIVINNEKIVTEFKDGTRSKHSVDFVGEVAIDQYNNKSYEIYEFKTQPKGFNEYNYRHFGNIYRIFNVYNVTCTLFCVVYEDSNSMHSELKKIEALDDIEKIDINVIGGDTLDKLEMAIAS